MFKRVSVSWITKEFGERIAADHQENKDSPETRMLYVITCVIACDM
jgi:hypothetical protein